MKLYKYPVLMLVCSLVFMSACTSVKTSNDVASDNPSRTENNAIELTGTFWMLKRFDAAVSQDSFVIDAPNRYTLTLLPNGLYQVKADCNHMQGAYNLKGNRLTLAPGAATLAECGPYSRYADYLRILAEVERYEMVSNHELYLLTGRGTLIFQNDGLEIDHRALN